jgi:predicted DCC family thiol-disulfide oxidoreductase YuxK
MGLSGAESEIEVFYDGDCYVCGREMKWLRGRDAEGHIRFTDIAAPGFDADRDAGIPIERLRDCIQARLHSGEVLEGMDVFRQLYEIVGFPGLVRLTRLPGVTRILDEAYYLFARHRPQLTARCEDRTCAKRTEARHE